MTRVFIWKNNSPQEWEEISFSAFSKARRNGCFTGRFFVETVKMFRDEDDRIIMECSRKDFEKYQQEDRHSRYLQEHEKSRSIFPASHVGDRDGTEEGYQDTDLFVDESVDTAEQAIQNLLLEDLHQALLKLSPAERDFILSYYEMKIPNATCLNLAFSCSLRIGEMLGLTWDCIDIAPQSIENGSAYIFVNKELQRVTRGALDDLSDKGVIKKFPPCIASTHTALVLKEPKTKTSIRRVYLPKTVAYMLVERKKEIDELMDLFGDEYIDNNLVFCSSNGRPMESQVINRAFNKLIKENGLPHVVFHSLRHSSITYKLKLNGGDMKSVQGDSGHAQVKMVADVYSHIIDEDRCINAQRLEEAFYSSKTPDPVEDTEPKTADTAVTESDESDAAKILELLKNPETAALLKQLAKAL